MGPTSHDKGSGLRIQEMKLRVWYMLYMSQGSYFDSRNILEEVFGDWKIGRLQHIPTVSSWLRWECSNLFEVVVVILHAVW